MSTNIEAPTLGAETVLLEEKNRLIIAAQAGFVEAVANRLRYHAENDVSPREIFNVGAAALQGYERQLPPETNTRHVETIGVVLAETAMREPTRPNIDMVSDDHIGVLLESKMRESTRNPLITLLLGKGAIGYNLKKELSLHIPDEAYDDFLVSLSPEQPEIDEKPAENPFARTKTLKELKAAFDNQVNKDSDEIVSAFNEIALIRILDSKIPFKDSSEYYDNLKPVQAEAEDEEIETMTRIHLALDIKFLERASALTTYGNIDLLKQLLTNYELKTSPDHEVFENLSLRVGQYASKAFAGVFETAKVEDFSPRQSLAGTEDRKRQDHEEIIAKNDYSSLTLDLVKLASEDTPQELKDLYKETFKNTEDTSAIKQIFIATAINKMRERGASYASVNAMSHVYELVDSQEVKNDIAAIHDKFLIAYVRLLDERKDFTMIHQLLSTVRFLLDDGHPIVEAGRELYFKSVREVIKQNKTSES